MTHDDVSRELQAATDLSGDATRAQQWFRTAPDSWGRRETAQELVDQGRATDVLAYIESLEAAGAVGDPMSKPRKNFAMSSEVEE